jgi:sn1-specific diacylglycerol lipase
MGTDEMSRDAFKDLGSKSSFILLSLAFSLEVNAKYKPITFTIFFCFLEIMSMLFEDVDLVPSDLAAGLFILNLKSKAEAERRNLEGVVVDGGGDEVDSFSVTNAENYKQNLKFNISVSSSVGILNDPWNTPQIISHFMKFALGSYGWPWYLVAHMKTGLCRLYENLLCCGCCV